MSKSKLKIGLLGSGSMGSVHASAYKAIENVEVAGVFSRDYEHAKAVARICDAKPVNDADALLDDPTIDASMFACHLRTMLNSSSQPWNAANMFFARRLSRYICGMPKP